MPARSSNPWSRHGLQWWLYAFWVCWIGSIPMPLTAQPRFAFTNEDVIAWIGGANTASMAQSGHLETLLTARLPQLALHFRNLGWEADTVYAQPRDLHFPTLIELLKKFQATAVVIEWGQSESLKGSTPQSIQSFTEAYEQWIQQIRPLTSRILLVTPVPFEATSPPLPNLLPKNKDLTKYAEVIRELSRKYHLTLIDVSKRLLEREVDGPRWTDDGMHLNAYGHTLVAEIWTRELGLVASSQPFEECTVQGAYRNRGLEQLRQTILSKNRLWFDYWRPMNWAFLNGDRTEQPSSRDHIHPNIRWFPSEMEQFVPLLYQAEQTIRTQASSIDSLK